MADAVTKALFERLSTDGQRVEGVIEVQFNPAELALSKGAQLAEIAIPGLDSPVLQFVRGQNEQISLELFFDSTEDGTAGAVVPVTLRTNQLYALVKMTGRDHAPPRCRLIWGRELPGLANHQGDVVAPRNAFECVVESVEQKFTLFSPDGVPLRATVTVALREYKTLATQLQQLNLQTADHTRVHTVARGETLPAIAHRFYGAAERWRHIADANGLRDVRRLAPGTTLQLPPVPATEVRR